MYEVITYFIFCTSVANIDGVSLNVPTMTNTCTQLSINCCGGRVLPAPTYEAMIEQTAEKFPETEYPSCILDAVKPFFFQVNSCDDILSSFPKDVKNTFKSIVQPMNVCNEPISTVPPYLTTITTNQVLTTSNVNIDTKSNVTEKDNKADTSNDVSAMDNDNKKQSTDDNITEIKSKENEEYIDKFKSLIKHNIEVLENSPHSSEEFMSSVERDQALIEYVEIQPKNSMLGNKLFEKMILLSNSALSNNLDSNIETKNTTPSSNSNIFDSIGSKQFNLKDSTPEILDLQGHNEIDVLYESLDSNRKNGSASEPDSERFEMNSSFNLSEAMTTMPGVLLAPLANDEALAYFASEVTQAPDTNSTLFIVHEDVNESMDNYTSSFGSLVELKSIIENLTNLFYTPTSTLPLEIITAATTAM